ncbi:MAG: hypothetical protein JKY37_32725 [Nannocystaceae bacterium]|nr:hypothetical protein [Nannocystaceae bacterium]
MLAMDMHGIRPGLVSVWVYVALIGGLAYHFTPKKWIDESLYRIYQRTPGVVLGLLFVALCYGLMLLLAGAPRAFIYFQF